MLRKLIIAFAIIFHVFTSSGHAEELKTRPKVGLVLAGGGALGFAHVGVIKVLEENRIPVDIVTGTSMGSIVGAAYAVGRTGSEMESFITQVNWDDLFNESIPRQDLPYRMKPGRDREIYGDAKLGIKNGDVTSLTGLVYGQRVFPVLQQLYEPVPSPINFDDLPVRYRAVAADIETGQPIVLSSGDIATAARASMSVPGFFVPVEINGRLLVDGGIANNLPIDIAKEMGAEVTIAVELYADLKKRQDLTSAISISGQIISLLLAQNSTYQRGLLTPRDILIAPDLKGRGSTDFGEAKDLIARGEAAARAAVPRLSALSLSEEEYAEYARHRATAFPNAPVRIDFIRINNESGLSDEITRSYLTSNEGDIADPKQIETDLQKLYDTGRFSRVQYNLTTEEGKNGLVITTEEKEWFRNYLRVGLNLEDDFAGDNSFLLAAAFRMNSLNSYGAYAETQLSVGQITEAQGEFYQPIAPASPYFVSPLLDIGETSMDLRQDSDLIAKYTRAEGRGALRFGRELGSYGETYVGYSRGHGRVERQVGDPTLPEFTYETGEVFSSIKLDKTDTPDFPTKGFLARTDYTYSSRALGGEQNFNMLTGVVGLPITFGSNTIAFHGEFGETFQDAPVNYASTFGGFLDVSGFQRASLLATDYTKGQIMGHTRFSQLGGKLFGLGFYAGGSFELTNLRSDVAQLPDYGTIISGSVFIGADTPLLPLYLGFGISDDNTYSFYLNLGRIVGNKRY